MIFYIKQLTLTSKKSLGFVVFLSRVCSLVYSSVCSLANQFTYLKRYHKQLVYQMNCEAWLEYSLEKNLTIKFTFKKFERLKT